MFYHNLSTPTQIILLVGFIFCIGVIAAVFPWPYRRRKKIVTLPVANYDEELIQQNRKLQADLAMAVSLEGKAMHPRQFMKPGDEIEVIGEMPVDGSTDFNLVVMCRDPRSGIGFIFVNLVQHTIQGVDAQKLPTDRRVPNGRYRYEEFETKSTEKIERLFIRVKDEEPDPLERRRIEGNLDGVGNGEGILDLYREDDGNIQSEIEDFFFGDHTSKTASDGDSQN